MAMKLTSSKGSTSRVRHTRAGFTILELMLSMVMLLTIMGAALNLYQRQTRTVAQQARKLDALANAQYAMGAIERELRIAGVGVGPGQPVLVAATSKSIVFNTNLVSRDSNDFTAVYLNLDADPATTGAFPVSRRLMLPGQTTDIYPDSTYRARNGAVSLAETIAFWFSRDSTSTDPTEHVLFRRVNDAPAEVVAKGILITAADTVFQYFKADTLDRLTPITPATLPLTHVAASHLSGGDTARFALIDSVRIVRMRIKSVTRVMNQPPTVRRAETVVRILNAGMAGASTCGQTPLPTGVLAAVITPQGGALLTWSSSIDQDGGERDVQRYAIYRRAPIAGTAWDEPITSIPAAGSQGTYTYTDNNAPRGQSWEYGVAAQDCTPSNSQVAKSAAVLIP
jgi:type II secretory pathway pseudopilin PulG